MALDLSQLTQEDLESLAALIKTGGNRSPVWKPLRDMRAPSTQKGRLNRPHFEWSAEDDGVTVIKPFPRLYWDAKGMERRVDTPEELARLGEGWTPYPPLSGPVNTVDSVQRELDSLSPEDREWVLKAEREARLTRLKERMSGLTSTERDAMTTVPAVPVSIESGKKAKAS